MQLCIPAELQTRQEIRTAVREAIASQGLQAPVLPQHILSEAQALLQRKKWDTNLQAYIGTHFANELWRDAIISIEPSQRLLLLPQNKDATDCVSLEELACSTGITVVTLDDEEAIAQAIISAQYRTIIAVGDFPTLHSGWEKIGALGVPVAAFPLVEGKLKDIAWVEELLSDEVASEDDFYDFNTARAEVHTWFSVTEVSDLFKSTHTETEEIGIRWVAAAGKRWRPLLAYYVYTILTGDTSSPEAIQKIALAVECFHKASLVHDDIEDDDDTRYGENAMHIEYGIPLALNVGDYLIGEGYRMIAQSGYEADYIRRMVLVASEGHRSLSLGQGEELSWMRTPTAINREKVLNIFRLKTSPAFDVALSMGAIAGGADDSQCAILKEFSAALGIAFQIRDDMLDFFGDDAGADIAAMRPSVLLAMVREECSDTIAQIIDVAWVDKKLSEESQLSIQQEADRLDMRAKANALLHIYKQEAIEALLQLENKQVQDLLRYVLSKIV